MIAEVFLLFFLMSCFRWKTFKTGENRSARMRSPRSWWIIFGGEISFCCETEQSTNKMIKRMKLSSCGEWRMNNKSVDAINADDDNKTFSLVVIFFLEKHFPLLRRSRLEDKRDKNKSKLSKSSFFLTANLIKSKFFLGKIRKLNDNEQ